MTVPLLITFAKETTLLRERHRPSQLTIYRNGPPGTFVLFPGGFRVSLPTDQITEADDAAGHVRVGFGGMTFAGAVDGRLRFHRVRELHPESALSPARSHTMWLDSEWITTVHEHGRQVWP